MKIIGKFRFITVTIICALFVAFAMPKTEKIGDRLQYALPIIGFVCALDVKEAPAYLGRFIAGLASVHLLKNALPDSGINLRPDGGGNGFPSGHTYSSVFGASYIAYQCAEKIPYIGSIVEVAAGFTAVSRVDSERHSPMQVLFGALFGTVFERALRKRKQKKLMNSH